MQQRDAERIGELERSKAAIERQLAEAEAERRRLAERLGHSEQLASKLSSEKNALLGEQEALRAALAAAQIEAAQTSASKKSSSNGGMAAAADEALAGMRVKALERRVDELSKERNLLSVGKEDLAIKLEETVNELSKRNEAQDLLRMQLELERKRASEESARVRKQLVEANESSASVRRELDALQAQLGERTAQCERVTRERANVERALSRAADESEAMRRGYEAEIKALKEQHLRLIERLGAAEAKLISSESQTTGNEQLHQQRSALDAKDRQLDELREQLTRANTDLANALSKQRELQQQTNLLTLAEQRIEPAKSAAAAAAPTNHESDALKVSSIDKVDNNKKKEN